MLFIVWTFFIILHVCMHICIYIVLPMMTYWLHLLFDFFEICMKFNKQLQSFTFLSCEYSSYCIIFSDCMDCYTCLQCVSSFSIINVTNDSVIFLFFVYLFYFSIINFDCFLLYDWHHLPYNVTIFLYGPNLQFIVS